MLRIARAPAAFAREATTTLTQGAGANLRVIQALLGHRSLSTTAHYTHLSTATFLGTKSPLDLPTRAS